MLLFLDLETTGFDNKKDAILEIAAARWDGEKIVDKYETLVKIDESVEISKFVQSLTGITPEMCKKEGIPISQAKEELEQFLQDDDIIIGHNISFDTGFLKANNFNVPQKEIDTFILSLLVMGREEESHALEVLAEKYGLVHDNAHRAMSDVEANIGFYEVMEIFWTHNFSQQFYDFINTKLDIVQFPEIYFFRSCEKKKEILLKNKIPQPTFPPFEQQWNEKNEKFEEVLEIMSQTPTEEKKSIFWETSLPDRNIDVFIEEYRKNKKPLVFLYPDDKKMKYQEFFDFLQKKHENIIFLNSASEEFDEKKWEIFTKKEKKNREETLVYCKTMRAKELHQEYALKFMREEAIVARNLYKEITEITENILPKNYSSLFLPFSYYNIVPKNIQIIALEGDRIEDLLTSSHTTKIFTNRWREDEKTNEKQEDMNEKAKEWDILLAKISQILRKAKGENKYSLPIPYSQAKNIDEFPALWMHGKNIIEEMPENIQKQWKMFFSSEIDNNFFYCIDLFPDNELAFSATPIDISLYAGNILEKNILVMGSSFPRYDEKILFSFPLPETVIDIPHEKEKFTHFSVPSVKRTITVKESIPFLVKKMETGKNILFSVNSKKICDEISQEMREYIKTSQSDYRVLAQGAGSVGKIRVKLASENPKIFISTPRYLDIVRPEDFNFTELMIMKPMFDPTKNPFLSERRKLYRSDFEEFAMPRAVYRFEKELRRLEKTESVFLGDGRVGDTKSWARIFWRGEEQRLL